MDVSAWELLLFAACLFLSGAFSGAETALTSLSRVKIRRLIEEFGDRARLLEHWIDEPERYLTTLLICNNLVNVGASAMATILATRLLGAHRLGQAAGLATGVMTLLILVFGEITPKHFSRRHASRIALASIRMLHWLSILLMPLEKTLSGFSSIIVFALSLGKVPSTSSFGEAELKAALALSQEAGVIEPKEKQMIQGVLEFADTTIREIMVPRVRMTALPIDACPDEVKRMVLESPHRRIPVYEESRDHIIGVLHAYDLLRCWASGKVPELQGLLRPIPFIPETKPVSEMLTFLQQERMHLAIVINEYGGVEGLVSLEDVLEEIVGEIIDEHDRPSTRMRKLESGCYVIDAGVEIKQAARELHAEFGETSATSVGGWLIEQLGHIPIVGEQFQTEHHNFSVTEATHRAIKKIQIRRVK